MTTRPERAWSLSRRTPRGSTCLWRSWSDLEAERARLTKELEKAKKQLEAQEKKLANENFVSRAPEAVVNAERERAEKAKALIANLEGSLAELG